MEMPKYTQLNEALEKTSSTEEFKSVVKCIIDDLAKKDDQIEAQKLEIRALRNEVTELEQRVTEQERYSSKDCLIVENAPIDMSDTTISLEKKMSAFFLEYFNFKSQPCDWKACHPLGRGKGIYPPAIIIKFIFFSDKNEIYARRSMLGKCKNPINQKPIYIKERLPRRDMDLLKEAKERKMIVTTKNCQVKIFCKDNEGNSCAIPIDSVRAIDDLEDKAIKTKPRGNNHQQQHFSASHQQQPVNDDSIQQQSSSHNSASQVLQVTHENFMKRLRETEAEDERLLLLKNITPSSKKMNNITPENE